MDAAKISEITGIPANDVRGIIALWCNVFGDSENDVCEYLMLYARPGTYLLAHDEITGNVIGMVHFPTLTDSAGRKYTYLYALAVDEHYRGTGIASALVEQLFKDTKCSTVATIPASESLRSWYGKRFGFTYAPPYVNILDNAKIYLGTGDPQSDIIMIKHLDNHAK